MAEQVAACTTKLDAGSLSRVPNEKGRRWVKTPLTFLLVYTPLTGPGDGPGKKGQEEVEDGNEKVTSPKFTQWSLPLRVGAWALMRDPVELLPQRARGCWDWSWRGVWTGGGRSVQRSVVFVTPAASGLKAPSEGRRRRRGEDACESYLF